MQKSNHLNYNIYTVAGNQHLYGYFADPQPGELEALADYHGFMTYQFTEWEVSSPALRTLGRLLTRLAVLTQFRDLTTHLTGAQIRRPILNCGPEIFDGVLEDLTDAGLIGVRCTTDGEALYNRAGTPDAFTAAIRQAKVFAVEQHGYIQTLRLRHCDKPFSADLD